MNACPLLRCYTCPPAEVLRTKRTCHATQNPFDYNVQLYTMLTRPPSVGSYQSLG